MKRQRFVIDTSAFIGVGESKKADLKHVKLMVKLLGNARKHSITCYTPPAVWNELKGMLERSGYTEKLIKTLDARLVQKSPSRRELMVPAEFVYEYISEIRDRMNKALREAEKAVFKKGENRPDDIVLRELRQNFKIIMRQGIVDSKEDLDVLFLAKELDAGVVSRDKGIMEWADKWGIRFIHAESFPELLKELSKK